MHRKTQLVARRGERVVEAAQEQAEATKGGEPLSVAGLPGAAISTERAAEWQAVTYERWAADVSGTDVLLGRAVMALAQQLRTVASQAAGLREDARDALDAAEE